MKLGSGARRHVETMTTSTRQPEAALEPQAEPRL